MTAVAEAASRKAIGVRDKFDAVAAALQAKAANGSADAALDANKLKDRAERLFRDTRFKFERLQVRFVSVV